LRTAGLALSLLAGAGYFLYVVNGHYAIRSWLFPIYVGYWLLTVVFNGACVSAGYAILRKFGPRGLPERERIVLSMAVGVLVFSLGMFLAGLGHAYGPTFFFVWPAILGASGAVAIVRRARRARRLVRALSSAPSRRGGGLVSAAVAAFGVLGLGLIYLSVMTPENVSFDGCWYHLPIAEHYAAKHGIEPFPEGWYQGALPQLASYLYTWAMLSPWGHVVDHVLLCSHIELSLFLWTLYGVAVLARRLVPGRSMRLAWVAVFLFPCIFVYDANLNTTADHIAAFWAVPIFLALLRVWQRLDVRNVVLLGVLLAAAVDTKYQAASLVAVPSVALGVRVAGGVVRPPAQGRRAPLLAGASAAIAGIVVWSPHWLKNLAFYGDPLYPLMHGVFPSRPWTADSGLRLALMEMIHIWRPAGSPAHRILEALGATWSFSFVPHDWGRLEGTPLFGSLFTLLLFAMPFLRARARLWALYLCAGGGVFVWYLLSHQDRYLQALLPWFASCVAASIALVWDSGKVARLALGCLVGAQVVWGGDAPFVHAHRMVGESQLKIAIDRITSGFDHDFARRVRAFGDLVEVGEALPPKATVLVHEQEVHLGLQHASVNDSPEWQGGISYGRFRSPAELDGALRAFGVTHLAMLTGKSKDVDALPGDVAFFDYVTHFARKWRTFGGWTVFEMPATRPSDAPYGDILWLGCPNRYAKGRYSMIDMATPFAAADLGVSFPRPRAPVSGQDQSEIDQEAERVDAVGFDPVCQSIAPSQLASAFVHVTDRGRLQVWIRRRHHDGVSR
jgi:hypothetical protein